MHLSADALLGHPIIGIVALLSVAACSSAGSSSGAPDKTEPTAPAATPASDEPASRQLAQVTSIEALADALSSSTGWHEKVDVGGVKARERAALLEGDRTDGAYFAAAWRTMNAFPQGHQFLFSSDTSRTSICGVAANLQQSSRFGVCARPSAAGLTVTLAHAGNKLGLAAGDVVTKAGTDAGDALFEASYLRSVCGAVYPAASGRRYSGAASFFGNVPPGTVLRVRSPSGAMRDVTVPIESDLASTDCKDPFGRNRDVYAEAKVRPDGVAVIRLPNFLPYDKETPSNASVAELDAFIAAYQGELVKVFDTVKNAPGIVWDVRGNEGGFTRVALAIVSGFATSRKTAVSYCRSRIPGSSPPSFDAERYALYGVEPGGPFAYAGKVAVVSDGLAYSAGSYFPLAAMKGTSAPVVGSSSAGAYGGGGETIELSGPPKLSATSDPTACFDGATDAPLEAASLPPTVAVEYESADAAIGKDTVVERAVLELGL